VRISDVVVEGEVVLGAGRVMCFSRSERKSGLWQRRVVENERWHERQEVREALDTRRCSGFILEGCVG
jgi:hypothetical protein